MTPEKAKHMEEITAANIGKRLAIVFNGQVLTAPMIRERVGDSIQITLGGRDPNDRFWERLPWLRERIVKERTEAVHSSNRNLIAYALGGLALIGAALWFAFRDRAPR